MADKISGQEIEQLRVGGSRAHFSEVVDRSDQTLSENMMPKPVYQDAPCKGIIGMGDVLGPFQAPASGAF